MNLIDLALVKHVENLDIQRRNASVYKRHLRLPNPTDNRNIGRIRKDKISAKG
jgi:hypothetical protein